MDLPARGSSGERFAYLLLFVGGRGGIRQLGTEKRRQRPVRGQYVVVLVMLFIRLYFNHPQTDSCSFKSSYIAT